jgi:hypothetical protein
MMSMGKDVIMSHIAAQVRKSIGRPNDTDRDSVLAAAMIFSLGQLSPIVDTITSEVMGFEWKIVIKKHEHAVKPDHESDRYG